MALRRLLYRRLLRLGQTLDGDAFLRSVVAGRPLLVFNAARDTWETAPGPHADALRTELLSSRRFGAVPRPSKGIRTLFRAACVEAEGTAETKLHARAFEQLRWLTAAVAAGEELRELSHQGVAPAASGVGNWWSAQRLCSGMLLAAHPLAWSGESAMRHSVSVLTSLGTRRAEGLLLNEPTGHTVGDLIDGQVPSSSPLPYTSALSFFASRPLMHGGGPAAQTNSQGCTPSERRRALELHVLHPYPDVDGSVQIARGMYRWGDIAQMAAMCVDPSHPAKPDHFHFLRGSIRWSLSELRGELSQGSVAALPGDSVPLTETLTCANLHSPHAAWHQVCAANKGVSAWAAFPNYRDEGVADVVTRYVCQLDHPSEAIAAGA
eukprot:TRINITY_DN4505_c0_g2_i1.p1 TRINITY_DN4505_c0_g2~~TRINITY_DN4505_c0_g2_i1.p1  ORF type:complete len:379 (+),score=79.90 TRINITY_DN4505_c0_g2_i1:52-1188(+)